MAQSHSKTSLPPERLHLAYFLGTLGVMAFAATLPVTQIALRDFSPGFITFARALIAAILALIALIIFRKPFHHPASKQIFLAGIFVIYAFPGFMAIALQSIPASHGGIVLGILPLTTAIIARLIANEKPSKAFWTVSLLGCILVISYMAYTSDGFGLTGFSIGYLWLVLAGISASAGYVIFGKLSKTTPGWEIISRALVLNLPFIVIGTYFFYDPNLLHPSKQGIYALLYLGSVSMFLGFCFWNVALAMGGIARIGQLQLLQIFFTLGFSALLTGEKIDFITILAAVLITALIALSRKV